MVLNLGAMLVGTTVIFFSQTIGGAVLVSVGQNVRANRAVEELRNHVPLVGPRIVLDIGGTNLKPVARLRYLDRAIKA